MTRLKMEDLMRKAAQEPSFEMQEEHMAQAMGMIRSKKKNRWGVIWFGSGLIGVIALIALGLNFSNENELAEYGSVESVLSSTTSTSTTTTSTKASTKASTKSKASTTSSKEQIESNSQREKSAVVLPKPRQSKSKVTVSNIIASQPIENEIAAKEFIQGMTLVKENNEVAIKSESNSVKIEKQVSRNLSDYILTGEKMDGQTRIIIAPVLKLKNVEMGNLDSDDDNNIDFVSAIKTRRPIHFGLTLGMSFFKPTANDDNVRSFDIGLVAKKKISNQIYLSVEPSLQWSTGYDQLHVVQRVDNFGLEVTSDFFAIQPKHVINGKVILGLGWERNRWAVQLSPQLLFAPQGYGSLNSLKNDTGHYSFEREIKEGWITAKNTSPFTYGAEVGIMYRIKWNAQLQISTGWRSALFFKEQEIRRTDDEPALHIGFQYRQDF